jgi:integrase/recombinase XerD
MGKDNGRDGHMTTQLLEPQQEPRLFDSRTQGFIDQLKKSSTKKAYSAGLREFQYLLSKKNLTIYEWVELVDKDRLKSPLEATNVGTDTLKEFVDHMEKKSFSANTINLYVASVQSLIKFLYRGRYQITAEFAGLPEPDPESDKEEWTLDLVSKFFLSMDKPVYRALVAVIFQSGLGLEEVLSLKYKAIQEEYEQGTRPICLELKRRKTAVPFQTFLGSVAVNQLTEYFKAEGTPALEQPVFHRETDPKLLGSEMKPMSKGAIERYFARRARRFIKTPWVGENPRRPHSLRAAFQRLLILAGFAEVFTEYFMGHEVARNKQAYIIKGMGREEFREQYRKFEFALTFSTEPKIEGRYKV